MKYLRKIILEEIQNVIKEEEVQNNEVPKEVLKFDDEGKQVEELQQKLKDLGFIRFKSGNPTGYYGPYTRKAVRNYQISKRLKRIDGVAGQETLRSLGLVSKVSKGKAIEKTDAPTIEKCPIPSDLTDQTKISEYEKLSQDFMSTGIPQRVSCEISYIKIRPEYKEKSFFVVDTRDNLLYLYDTAGKFVAKTHIVDGSQAQSKNEELIAKALMNADAFLEAEGIERRGDSFYDTKKKKDLGPHGYLNAVNKVGTRFWPQGIYTIKDLETDSSYAGGKNNVFVIQTLDGRELSNALHGFYKTDPNRGPWLEKMRKKYKINPTDPAVAKEYLDYVRKNIGRVVGGNMSYGCINFPVDFLKLARPYAKNSFVFVLGETEEGYLVKNTQNFFNSAIKIRDVDSIIASNKNNIIDVKIPGSEQDTRQTANV